jgi:two-component system chemotaxis response regulator CheY
MAVDFNLPILFVYPNGQMKMIIKRMITGMGFKSVTEAAGGSDALTKIKEKSYGLVVMGWEFDLLGDRNILLQGMREAGGSLESIPFVLIFGSDAELKKATIDIGTSSSIIRPFDQAGLKKSFVKLLGEF